MKTKHRGHACGVAIERGHTLATSNARNRGRCDQEVEGWAWMSADERAAAGGEWRRERGGESGRERKRGRGRKAEGREEGEREGEGDGERGKARSRDTHTSKERTPRHGT